MTAALAALLALQLSAAVPALTGPVVDEAGLLSGAERRRLEGLSRAARAVNGGTGVQLQYLLVPSLDGQPIEDFSIKVAEAWKLGTKGQDNGVLVTVAVKDRAVRIEVGGGLEGGLTDAQSSRIIRGVIAPAFRERRFGDGLYDAGLQILSATGGLPPEVARRQAARPSHESRGGGLAVVLVIIGFLVLRGLLGFSGRRRRGFWGGGPFIGGGWGGGGSGWGGGGFGGGGGGGWSGGGGGFSGGGSSGSW